MDRRSLILRRLTDENQSANQPEAVGESRMDGHAVPDVFLKMSQRYNSGFRIIGESIPRNNKTNVTLDEAVLKVNSCFLFPCFSML